VVLLVISFQGEAHESYEGTTWECSTSLFVDGEEYNDDGDLLGNYAANELGSPFKMTMVNLDAPEEPLVFICPFPKMDLGIRSFAASLE
jgi:hypothetical protein